MKIYGIRLDGSIRILPYDNAQNFSYETIDSIASSDNRISFNALVEIKQSDELPNQELTLELIHLHDEAHTDESPTQEHPTLSTLFLESLPLSGFDKAKGYSIIKNDPKAKISGDPWLIKQRIKWSFVSVPTDGLGSYALALSIKSPKDPDKMLLIDCDYFEVT